MNNTTVDEHAELIKANDEIAHDLIPAMVYVGVLMLLGIAGNLLVCFVFVFRLRMTTQDCLISALAMFDLLSCFIAMPTEIVDMRYFLMFNNEFACRLLRFIIHYCAFGSILTLVVIALDRYVKVCHPLQRQMSLKNVKIAILFILLVTLIFAFPATILYGTRTTEVDDLAISGHDCSINDNVKDTIFPLIYNTVLFVAFFLIFIMLTVIYIRIWREMKRHRIYMARNSVAGESRLYLSSASEVSGYQIRAGSRRGSSSPVVENENGRGDEFAECGYCGRNAQGEKEERDSVGSNSSRECHLPSTHSDTTLCGGEDTAESGFEAVEQGFKAVSPDNSSAQNPTTTSAEKGLCHDGQHLANGEQTPPPSPVVKSDCSPNPGDVDTKRQNGQAFPSDSGDTGQAIPTDSRHVGQVFPTDSGNTGQEAIPTDSNLAHGKTQTANGTVPSDHPPHQTVPASDNTARTEHPTSLPSCPHSLNSSPSPSSIPSPISIPSPTSIPSPISIPSPSFIPSPTSGTRNSTQNETRCENDSNEAMLADSVEGVDVKDSAVVEASDFQTESIPLGNVDDQGSSVSNAKQTRFLQTDVGVEEEQENVTCHSDVSTPFRTGRNNQEDEEKSVSIDFNKPSRERCVCSLTHASTTTTTTTTTVNNNTNTSPHPNPNHNHNHTLTDVTITSPHSQDRVVTNNAETETGPTTTTTTTTTTSNNNNKLDSNTVSETITKRTLTKRKSASEVKSHKATVIAMSVTVVFFLSFVPHLSLVTVRTINTEFDRHLTGASLVFYNIFLRSYFINSVSNPIIYGVFNSRFRKEVLHVFRQVVSCCCRCCQR